MKIKLHSFSSVGRKHREPSCAGWLGCRLAVAFLLLAGAFCPLARAANYTWTNTADQSVGYWTNNALWNPASGHPGGTAGDSAYLTNSASGAYTNIYDSTVANSLSTVALSNALGQAWLIVTNATLTGSTLRLGNGAQLQVDAGGVVTGVTTLGWVGTTGTINLNNGGQLFTSGGPSLGSSNTTATVTANGTSGTWHSAQNIGLGGVSNSVIVQDKAMWDLGGKTLAVGGGANGTLVVNGGTITNFQSNGMLSVGSSGTGNQMIVSNGGSVYASGLSMGGVAGANNNTLLVTDPGSSLSFSGWGGSWGELGDNGAGNQLIVSNGASVVYSTGNQLGIGWETASASNNLLQVTGAGSKFTLYSSLTVGSAWGYAGGSGNRVEVRDSGTLNVSGTVALYRTNVSVR